MVDRRPGFAAGSRLIVNDHRRQHGSLSLARANVAGQIFPGYSPKDCD